MARLIDAALFLTVEEFRRRPLIGVQPWSLANKLTTADLVECLDEVLDRVRSGERFAIEQEGEVVAEIGPRAAKSGITWGEFLDMYFEWPRPDDRFADDLEAIQAEQGTLPEPPEWPD